MVSASRFSDLHTFVSFREAARAGPSPPTLPGQETFREERNEYCSDRGIEPTSVHRRVQGLDQQVAGWRARDRQEVAMSIQSVIQFCAILFTALALVPALAHAMELPNKMRLPREHYLTVQSIYRGWALVGVLVVGALASTFLLMRSAGAAGFAPALIAFRDD
jgi:hypothetical protein